MTIETIGVPIDLKKGIHSNTELVDNKIQLKKLSATYDKTANIYTDEGFWLSDIIDLADKYTSLGNLAITNISTGSSTYKAYTRTSDDNIVWSDFIEIQAVTGRMMSPPQRYVQVKLSFNGSISNREEMIYDFVESESAKFKDNDYVKFDGNLQLKKEFQYTMSKDANWTSEGTVFKKKIENTKLKRIDSINFV